LVGSHDEVFSQNWDSNRLSHRSKIFETAGKPTLFGENRDAMSATRLVGLRQGRRIGDICQMALTRASPLDLSDHGHAFAAKECLCVEGRQDCFDSSLESIEGRDRHARREILAYALDDPV
jgi:hypothetical protein